jgi:hypothetical protein
MQSNLHKLSLLCLLSATHAAKLTQKTPTTTAATSAVAPAPQTQSLQKVDFDYLASDDRHKGLASMVTERANDFEKMGGRGIQAVLLQDVAQAAKVDTSIVTDELASSKDAMSSYVDSSIADKVKESQQKLKSGFELPSMDDMFSQVQSKVEAFDFDKLDADLAAWADKDPEFKNFDFIRLDDESSKGRMEAVMSDLNKQFGIEDKVKELTNADPSKVREKYAEEMKQDEVSLQDLTDSLKFNEDLLKNVRSSLDRSVQFNSFTNVFGDNINAQKAKEKSESVPDALKVEAVLPALAFGFSAV